MAGVKTDIKTIKDLKGKKVAIHPGSTQEAVILERLRMEGLSIKDIQPIRLMFSDHPAALARGDVRAARDLLERALLLAPDYNRAIALRTAVQGARGGYQRTL